MHAHTQQYVLCFTNKYTAEGGQPVMVYQGVPQAVASAGALTLG